MTTRQDGGIAISLVTATKGRTKELGRLLASIEEQTCRGFELIIVDQNADNRVETLLASSKLSIRHSLVRSEPGASKARNIGIELAQGETIGFPDDDCWYPPDLLVKVDEWFAKHKDFDFFCCSARDGAGQEVVSRWPRYSVPIDRSSVLRACACSALFMRRRAAIDCEGFDEEMGPGPKTPIQAAEEIDFVLRLIEKRYRGWFEKSLYIHHPRKDAATVTSDRAFSYGIALGYILRKHRYPKRIWMYQVLRAVGGAVRALCRGRTRAAAFYWKSAQGRARGYLGHSNRCAK